MNSYICNISLKEDENCQNWKNIIRKEILKKQMNLMERR